MSVSNNQKLDVLWKRYSGVTSTSGTKAPHNEAITTATPIFQKNFWTDSDRIPVPAPDDHVLDGDEIWADVVRPHFAETALPTIADVTTNNSAWQVVKSTTDANVDGNNQTNFVPDTFHRSYTIRVWAGDPNDSLIASQQLNPFVEDYEWIFDYTTGILYFPNKVPPVAVQNGIWVEGWTYTGSVGREGDSGGSATNTSKIKTFTFTTGLLMPTQSASFVFQTGGKCILVEAKLSSEGTLECHAVSTRDDTNPYRFKSLPTHLVDDGSYVIGGTRYYGERFVPLINMEDTTSDVTYWKVVNTSATPTVYTIVVKVA